MFTRRRFLIGSATVLTLPALVKAASLMPVRALDPALLRPTYPWRPHRAYKLGGLDGKTPIPASLMDAARSWSIGGRVAISRGTDGSYVSTVFLGIDHNHLGGPPLLFETMAFLPNGESADCQRYSTWDEAERGHDRMVAALALPKAVA